MDKTFNIGIADKRDEFKNEQLLTSLIDLVINNPFTGFQKMKLNNSDEWEHKPDLTIALKNIARKKNTNIQFGTRVPHYMWSSIDKDNVKNTIAMELSEDYFSNNDYGQLFNHVLGISQLLPEFFYAKINPIVQISDFYWENKIERVPSDTVRLYASWWHLTPPSVYLKDYTREEMLNIPAYKVKEHENGNIEMQVWENPFEYEKPENIEQLKKVVDYMRLHHRELKNQADE